MKKGKKYERKRKRYTFTLSDEAHDFLHESVTNASRFLESLIMNAKSGIQPVIMTVSPIGDGPGGIRTHGRPVMSRTTRTSEESRKEPQDGEIQGITHEEKPSKKPSKTQEKNKEGQPSYTFDLKDIETYISEVMPTARPKTMKGVRAGFKQFLGFGEIIEQKKKGTKITKLKSRISYTTVRTYNNHINTLKSGTALGYVRSILIYYGKKRGDQTLRDWGESLSYTKKKAHSLYSKPGDKAAVTWEDIEHDIRAFYSVICDPTIPRQFRTKKISAYRSMVNLLFGVTSGMRPEEMNRLSWEEINPQTMEQGYFIIAPEKTKTNADRVIPIHPAIRPYLELLTHLYQDKPFDTHNYRKYRKRDGCLLTIAQARNYAAKEWYNIGMNEKIRIAIMGHDEGQIKKEIEREDEEHVDSKITDSKYRKYGIKEIANEYQKTVGTKFNPIPAGIDIDKIRESLKEYMIY